MLLNKLKYKENDSAPLTYLEDWMKLAYFIGWFSRDQEENTKLYVSVPSNTIFSYFIALGAVDYGFKQERDLKSIKEKFLTLEYGTQVLYLTEDRWKKYTVLGLEEFPALNGVSRGISLKIKDTKNSITYVSERRWLTNMRIFSNKVNEVKNAKVMKNVSNLVEDPVLNLFYSQENLAAAEMNNKSKVLVSSVKTEWIENLSAVKFYAEGNHMNFNNFIFHDKGKSTFNNVKLLAEKEKLSGDQLEEVSILFVGAGKSLRGMDEYKKAKSIYLVDRYESTEKIDDLKMKISQTFLMDGSAIVNEKFLKAVAAANISLPKGVEIFAWQ